MKKSLKKYTDFAVKQTEALLNIDSPTGYTEEAALWVKTEFEKLGFEAKLTNKGFAERAEEVEKDPVFRFLPFGTSLSSTSPRAPSFMSRPGRCSGNPASRQAHA